ncbi:conserved hypothetical protein [Perkinsus marinus ATCC 50983]|uniref:Uncharacterized protein n=1 Tax=Perkinsus marinus (strain ATCC 50983 / TXsc) TaxID=423536 RepID=C5KFJ3_PERM5|nr:conserved hypothetical protein [Perkinsus marinus ATCC 50983]EER16742.1 conserved hypothetical protein [Perkinsus marinus ATCC 50983]|eukprot:XP_002784946.1 conserved hypothetical protein [Perkinsus marinus ATCC 50983]
MSAGGWAKKRRREERQKAYDEELPSLQAAASLFFHQASSSSGAAGVQQTIGNAPLGVEGICSSAEVPGKEDDRSKDESRLKDSDTNKAADDNSGRFPHRLLDNYGWLRYDALTATAYCVACRKYGLANSLGRGVTNFRRVTGQHGTFAAHDKSREHGSAMLRLSTESGRGTVLKQLVSTAADECKRGRRALLCIIDIVRSALRQNLPLRGHSHADSNCNQLIQLLRRHNSDLQWWLSRSSKVTFTSSETIRECITLIGVATMRAVASSLNGRLFSVVVDETSDVKGVEQVVIVVRTVCPTDLTPVETFLGWCSTKDQDAASLTRLVKDCLMRYSLPLGDCRGIATDGAANMVGVHSGLRTRIKAEFPAVLHTYCAGHALNLVCRQSADTCAPCKASIELIGQLAKHIKSSPKKLASWEEFVQLHRSPDDSRIVGDDLVEEYVSSQTESDGSSDEEAVAGPIRAQRLPTLKTLSDTRWLCNGRAVIAALANYELLLSYCSQDGTGGDSALVVLGERLDSFETFYCLRVLDDGFKTVLPVHATVQAPGLSICTVRDLLEDLKRRLSEKAQNWSKLVSFYQDAVEEAQSLGIDPPKLHRAARRGLRANLKYDVADLTMVGHIESVLLANAEVPSALKTLYQDIDWDALVGERQVMRAWFSSQGRTEMENGARLSMDDIIVGLKADIGGLLPQLRRLFITLLVLPASTCSAERAFSALPRIKTKLRTTISQDALNSYAICGINRSFCDELSLEALADEFIQARNGRINVCALSTQ